MKGGVAASGKRRRDGRPRELLRGGGCLLCLIPSVSLAASSAQTLVSQSFPLSENLSASHRQHSPC